MKARLPALLLVALYWIKASMLFRLGREVFYANTHQQHIPAEILRGALPRVEGTVPAFLSEHLLTFQPRFEALMMSLFEVPFFPIFVAMSLVQLALAILGTYWIGRAITRSSWGGLFTSAVLVWGWLHWTPMGYAIALDYGMYPGALGLSLGWFILGLWFSERWFLAAGLLGILFDVHAVNAIIIGGILAAHATLSATQRKLERRAVVKLVAGLAVAVVLALPALLLVIHVGPAAPPAGSLGQWWAWMRIRKAYHVFPWSQSYQLFQVCLLFGVLGVALLASRRRQAIESRPWTQALVLGVVVVFFCFLNWFGVEVLHSPDVASMILTRATVYAVPVASALVYVAIGRLLNSASAGAIALGLVVLASAFAPLTSPREWLLLAIWTIFGLMCFARSELPRDNRLIPWAGLISVGWLVVAAQSGRLAPIQMIASTAAFSFAFAPLLRIRPESLRRWGVITVAALVAIYGLADQVRAERAIRLEPTSDYHSLEELHDWLMANTPEQTILLAPPSITCAAYCLGRTPLIVSVDLGMSVYLRSAFPFEVKVLRSLFGVDISTAAGMERARALRLENSGYFDQAYRDLKAEDARRIALEFPGVSYAIRYRDEPEMALPLAYDNAKYRVYEIKR